MMQLMSEAVEGLCGGGASEGLAPSSEESGEESEYRLESSEAASVLCAMLACMKATSLR